MRCISIVIWFNNKKAREHLLKYGFVYTLRPFSTYSKDGVRKTGREPLFWKKKKIRGYVDVTFIKKIDNISDMSLDNNIHFLDNSGFDSMREWEKAANNEMYLYFVEIIKIIDLGDL